MNYSKKKVCQEDTMNLLMLNALCTSIHKQNKIIQQPEIIIHILTQHLHVDVLLGAADRLQAALGRRAREVTERIAHVQLPVHASEQIQRHRLAFGQVAFGRLRFEGRTVEFVLRIAFARQLRRRRAEQKQDGRCDQQRGDQQRGRCDGDFVHGRRCAQPNARRTADPAVGELEWDANR